MKQIINISLGSSREDYKLETEFLGHQFFIQRFGMDGDIEKAADELLKWNKKADAIGLGNIKFPYTIGSRHTMEQETRKLNKLGSQLNTPVTTGDALRIVGHEWSLRHIQYSFGGDYFTNSRVFFISGLVNSTIAKIMAEYTDNLTFADPVLENGIPRFLKSYKDLEMYAKGIHGILEWVPSKRFSLSASPLKRLNEYLMRKAIRKAHIVVVPYFDFYKHLENCTIDELRGKIIITSTAYDDRVNFLKERGVDVIIDSTPKILEKVVGFSVLEAMIIAALGVHRGQVRSDDLLEIISNQRMDPRVIYPSGKPRRVNRFAYITHPLNRQQLKKFRPIELLSTVAPESVMSAVEKAAAFSPPFVYSKVSGIKSPTGIEAEGWIITLGMTTEEMDAHSPKFTVNRLLSAAKTAKRLGAQIIGFGPLNKSMSGSTDMLTKFANIPITTGNHYIASSALWAAADAVRRMGLIKVEKGKLLKAKTMVIGATGPVGSICSRLLAKAFGEVHLVSRNMAKLLALQEEIAQESPEVSLHLSTRADKSIDEMDVIVTAASGARDILDIKKVKPGCVITDVTRPLILSKEQVKERPDVLVIKSGEIELPGNDVELGDIDLPPRAVPAGMAETILLAMEGRFESFTEGSNTQWAKVREIYKLGLKHGMKLTAISGVNGVISDEDIANVKQLVRKMSNFHLGKKRNPAKEAKQAPKMQTSMRN